MWLRKIADRGQDPTHGQNRGPKPLTRMQVIRGVRMRHYAWQKPLQQIADEVGLSLPTIRNVISGQPFDDLTYAKLVGYLATPQGPAALKRNRVRKAKSAGASGARAPLMHKLRTLTALAVRLIHHHPMSRDKLDAMTIGELWAYYWRLEFVVKEQIIRDRIKIAKRYIIPDHLQAYEWIERLNQLEERQTTSASGPRPSRHSAATKASPLTRQKMPSR